MARYILARAALTLPMLLILLTLVFVILRVLPGDPCLALLGGRNVSEERLNQCREDLGLNRPLHVQYLDYLSDIVRLDLGTSTRTGLPVTQELLLRFPATFELAVFGMVGATAIGMGTGVYASVRRDQNVDHVIRVLNIASFAMPIFWIGLMLLMLFAVQWRLLPAGGRLDPVAAAFFEPVTHFYTIDTLLQGDVSLFVSALRHLVLPSATLALVVSGFIGRMTRASMLDVLDKEYVSVARAKGLREWTVIRRHALSNALIPVVTVVGLQFALLMAGAILTETVYSWPGIARYLLEGISSRDFSAIQGAVVFIALFISAVNLLVDVLYARLDPRIRF